MSHAARFEAELAAARAQIAAEKAARQAYLQEAARAWKPVPVSRLRWNREKAATKVA